MTKQIKEGVIYSGLLFENYFQQEKCSRFGIGDEFELVCLKAIRGVFYSFALRTGKEDVAEPDPITFQCASACESQQKVAFCDVQRSFEGGLATCNELATNSQYSQYNVQTCPSISCTIPGTGGTQTNDQTCAGLGGTWVAPTESGTCPSQEGKLTRKRTPTDSPPTEEQICCYYYE